MKSVHIGRKVSLWTTKYVQGAYKDQHGVKHDAYVVDEQWLAIIAEAKEVPGVYGEGKHEGWKATTEKGEVFTCNWTRFPDDSMFPTFMWYMEKGRKVANDACQEYGRKMALILDKDGKRAIPLGAEACEQHELAFMPGDGCYLCQVGD